MNYEITDRYKGRGYPDPNNCCSRCDGMGCHPNGEKIIKCEVCKGTGKEFMETMEQAIMGALARGYTYKENEQKILDAELINAMTKEVVKLVDEGWEKFEKSV